MLYPWEPQFLKLGNVGDRISLAEFWQEFREIICPVTHRRNSASGSDAGIFHHFGKSVLCCAGIVCSVPSTHCCWSLPWRAHSLGLIPLPQDSRRCGKAFHRTALLQAKQPRAPAAFSHAGVWPLYCLWFLSVMWGMSYPCCRFFFIRLWPNPGRF